MRSDEIWLNILSRQLCRQKSKKLCRYSKNMHGILNKTVLFTTTTATTFCSSAMTRHYYHENEDVLRQAVAAIPTIGKREVFLDRINKIDRIKSDGAEKRGRSASVPARLKRLEKYLAQGLITQEEHAVQRARILAEL